MLDLGGQFTRRLAAVDRARGLEQHYFDLVVRNRPVFGATRKDDKFAGFDPFRAVAEFHTKAAADHQEKFVFRLMLMPNEWALEFDQLDLLAIQLADHLQFPMLIE